MIILRKLSLQRGSKPLFDSVDLTIHAGQKIGVTGANGSGKSSLFALLRGELHSDSGDLEMPPRLEIAHVAQETPALAVSAIDFVMDGDRELRELEAALRIAEAAHDGTQIAELHSRFDLIDGYSARSRAARMLHGLGFEPEQFDRSVAEFSGGWRMRLNLAQALMCRSDLLLLDEPTNHLDLDAVLWLEQWLKSYPGTLLLISHDRDFLDSTVNAIAHVEQQQITLYTGNYADFERQRAARLALQQAAFEKQQREMGHLQSYIDRFRASATKARQAQSRIKALERMEVIAAAHVDSPFYFSFRAAESMPNPVLRLEEVSAGYADNPILKHINLSLESGARIGLLGANGAGKSTLIKTLAGELPPVAGKRVEGKGLRIGYFAQHQLEQLRPDESPLQHLQRIDPTARESELRSFLGGFNFCGDAALSPVAPFSGGEKSRLALALLIWQRPNLLLLDEPTNHLDLEMRHALTLALQGYEGALVVVSHDRHLLRATTDSFLLTANGSAVPFDGDLEDYRRWRAEQAAADTNSGKEGKPQEVDRKARKREEAEERNRLAALRKPVEAKIKKLEKEIDALTVEKERLDHLLADASIYEDGKKESLKAALIQQAKAAEQLHQAEEAWLEQHTALEAMLEG